MTEHDNSPGFISSERRRADLSDALEELSMTVGDLVTYMDDQSTLDDSDAVIRSVKRMISGETKVSSEISSLVGSLLRRHRRMKVENPSVDWQETTSGSYFGKIGGWCVFLYPESKGRFLLRVAAGESPTDYSPPFRRWLSSLEEAKNKAYLAVDDGQTQMAQNIYHHPETRR